MTRRATVLVTGGGGFIGRAVVDALMLSGHGVKVIGTFSRPCAAAGFADSVSVYRGSIADPDILRQAAQGIDYCIHLAGSPVLANPRNTQTAAVAESRAVFERLFAVVMEANAPRVVPVIYASSAAVYRPDAPVPIPETAPVGPINAHGFEKAAIEHVASQIEAPTLGLRMFNIYGPGQSLASPYCSAVRIFLDRIASRRPITLFGDGSQQRDFVHVDDAVRFIMSALVQGWGGKDVVNICTGVATSLSRVIELLTAVTRITPVVEYLPARAVDVPISVGDPRKAETLYGFRTRVALEEGIRRLVVEAGPAPA